MALGFDVLNCKLWRHLDMRDLANEKYAGVLVVFHGYCIIQNHDLVGISLSLWNPTKLQTLT